MHHSELKTHLEFKFYGLPPSVNKLYFHRGGRRILSSSGREFKTRFITGAAGANKLELMNFQRSMELPYCLILVFFVKKKRLVNYSYGSNGRTKYQYKAFDSSNLVKVTEDALQELLGIPDQNNFTHVIRKVGIPDDEEDYFMGFLGLEGSEETKNAIMRAIEWTT